MCTLEISKKIAIKLYPSASGLFKTMLEDQFGKDALKIKITDRIRTWEDAAEEKGMHPEKSLPYQSPQNNREKACNAFFQMDVITEVLNEGWAPDWADSNQKKWWVWINNYKSGSGFSFYGSDFDWTSTGAGGGARLCVATQELGNHLGTYFMDIINQLSNPVK